MELVKIQASPSNDDERLSRQMQELRDQLGSAMRIADQFAAPVAPSANNVATERYVRILLKLRRHRDKFFEGGIFADPAWDILLELYAASLGQYRVSVSNLCVAAAVPATTALRWISLLEAQGLISRINDPIDHRRKFLALTIKATDAMEAYFRTVPVSAQLI